MSPYMLMMLVALVAALAPMAKAVVPAGTVAYADLAAFKGQFALTVGIADKEDGVVLPAVKHSCNATTFGAACNQPPFSQLDTVLSVSWQLKNLTAPIRTRFNSTPEEIRVKLCYQTISWTNRPWRKKNKAYPKYGLNCQITLGKVPFSTNGTIAFDLKHTTIPTALWHFVFLVRGMYPNTTGEIDYIQYESTENVNTVESVGVNGVTTEIIIAASILSAFCPLYFFAFIVTDHLLWKKNGRGLKVFKNK